MSERPAPGDPLPRSLALAGLAALAVWVFVQRHGFLTATPEPTGVDGYWYAVQLRSLLESGHLYHGGAPLALWLMAPLAALTSPVAGAKLGASLAAAALPVAVYFLARRIAGERAVGLFAAALVATSAGAFYLPTEFVKNAIALPVAVTALVALGRALERPGWRRALVAAVLVAAAGLCHKVGLAFALIGCIAPIAAVLWNWRRGGAHREFVAEAETDRDAHRDVPLRVPLPVPHKNQKDTLLPVIALVLALLLAAGALVLLVARDAALFDGLFTTGADWSIPALAGDGEPLTFRGEPAAAGLVGLAALILALLARRAAWLRPPTASSTAASTPSTADRALAIGPAVWAVAVALPWLDAGDPDGLTFRLRAMAFLPLALAAASVAAAALARLSPGARMAAVMFATGLVLVRPARYEAPVVRADPDLVAAVAALASHLPPGAVVIAPERHIVFMTTWLTRAPARLRPETTPPGHRHRLLPMSYMSDNLARAVDEARSAGGVARPVGLHRDHRNGLVLVAEPTWEWILGRLSPAERAYYRAWPVH